MRCKLHTTVIDGRTFVTGYYSDAEGFTLPDNLRDERQWRDAWGNPKWELLADGSIVLANIAPTQAQQDQKALDERVERAAGVLVKVIVQAIRGTAGPAASWAAIDAALRALLA